MQSPESIKWIMERACLRKQNLSEEGANEIVDEAAARGRVIYYYKCAFCGSHHMTSMPGEANQHLKVS